MTLPFELWVALRYMKAHRREFFVSLITWISVGGVALGVTALVVVLSVMTGFEEDLRGKILGANAHISIFPYGGAIKDYQSVLEIIAPVKGVVGATPYVASPVMIMSGGVVRGAVFRGIDVATAGQATDIEKFIGEKSRLKDLQGDAPGIFMGSELAKNMGTINGDAIQVVSPAGSATPVGMIPRIRAFQAVGTFTSGMYEIDNGSVFVSLSHAQDFLRMDGAVTGIEVRVDDIEEAEQTAKNIEAALFEQGLSFEVRDWMNMNFSLFHAIRLEKIAMSVILTLIVLVAAFNIASTLIMVVFEKTQEIGILKSIGACNRSIRLIFIIEGLTIGGTGTLLGLGGGWGLCEILKRTKFIDLPPGVYYIDKLPVVLNPGLFALVGVSAVALCFFATLYPAWQASRLDPVEILRYE